jgi:hypothetical protein
MENLATFFARNNKGTGLHAPHFAGIAPSSGAHGAPECNNCGGTWCNCPSVLGFENTKPQETTA